MEMISHKAELSFIENKKYRLMYTKVHKRGPGNIELWITQSLSKFGHIKHAWELDLDTNTWIPRET